MCTKGQYRRWRRGVARHWAREHKRLFDRDDLALIKNQTAYHFVEWLAAIHFAKTRRVRAVVAVWKEKVVGGRGGFKKYPRKAKTVRKLIGEWRYNELVRRLRGAGPDLFLYNPRIGQYWFAEVKKVGDRLNANQLGDIRMIEKLLPGSAGEGASAVARSSRS